MIVAVGKGLTVIVTGSVVFVLKTILELFIGDEAASKKIAEYSPEVRTSIFVVVVAVPIFV